MCSDIGIEDANKRAQMHVRRNHICVFIAQIETKQLGKTRLEIPFRNRTLFLPAWKDEGDTVSLISTSDLRHYMGVDYGISQLSEWLALDCIPKEFILNKYCPGAESSQSRDIRRGPTIAGGFLLL